MRKDALMDASVVPLVASKRRRYRAAALRLVTMKLRTIPGAALTVAVAAAGAWIDQIELPVVKTHLLPLKLTCAAHYRRYSSPKAEGKAAGTGICIGMGQ